MNLQELEKILTHAKSLGASEFECTDAESSLKVKFASHASVASLPVADEMSAEKLLYYATPYYDEILAKEEEHKKQIR